LALVTSNGGAPVPDNYGAVNYYTTTVNNGNISPETAFGYDLGADQRFGKDTVLSGDIYLTSLHGQFLTSTTQDGTYTASSGNNAGITAPLYVSQAENLADSRMQGLELTLVKKPTTGLGYRVQGDLMRAYTYNLPPGFYDTPGGIDTTNVAVLPNVNFPPSGPNYNGIGIGRVPYSAGYAELNYRKGSLFALLGVTYYGPDNSFNQPAFGVVNASFRWQIDKHTSLQVSGYNLTSAYNTPYAILNGGVPVPLINGMVGAVPGLNVGPTRALLTLKHEFGQ
jgi:outer membrane receptor protein involved in Fe transport